MKKEIYKKDSGGEVHLREDFDKHLFLARPHGVINPTLLAEDLKRASEFAEKIDDHWSYVSNTEGVRLVNPLNILFLKEIKKLKKLREIVIFAPGIFNRLLIRISSFIVRPDRVIKDKNEFRTYLKHAS